jgi:hypothetical protein
VSLASDKRVTFKRSVEEEKEGAILISKGIVFQAERTTMVETLQWMPIRAQYWPPCHTGAAPRAGLLLGPV